MIDLQDPREPFGTCALTTLGRKGKRCHACRKTIPSATPAYSFTLFNWTRDAVFFAHPGCFDGSELGRNYRERFLPNRYEPAAFRSFPHFVNAAYSDLIETFDAGKAIHRVAFPGLPAPWTADGVISPPREDVVEDAIPGARPDRAATGYLVDILVRCGFREVLVDALSRLPEATAVCLALHDDRIFQVAAARRFGEPRLAEALERLRKPRHSAEDLAFIAAVGKDSDRFAPALREAFPRYGLDESYVFLSPGFSGLDAAHHAQLCYFFIDRPGDLPTLRDYLETGLFPFDRVGSFTYTEVFFYRAAALHLARHRTGGAIGWMDAHEGRIDFHPAGSPKGFLADTRRLAAAMAP